MLMKHDENDFMKTKLDCLIISKHFHIKNMISRFNENCSYVLNIKSVNDYLRTNKFATIKMISKVYYPEYNF